MATVHKELSQRELLVQFKKNNSEEKKIKYQVTENQY